MTIRKRKTARSRTTKPASKMGTNGAKLHSRVVDTLRKRTRRTGKAGGRGAGALATAGDRITKKPLIQTLLQRPKGATIDDLKEATGWQAHSVRAALTGLRKEGHEIVRTKDDAGLTRYRTAGNG